MNVWEFLNNNIQVVVGFGVIVFWLLFMWLMNRN